MKVTLHRDLAALRNRSDVDVRTLSEVDQVLQRHAGTRVVIAPGLARIKRLQAARVLMIGADTPQAARERIRTALGVSASTARRYMSELQPPARQ